MKRTILIVDDEKNVRDIGRAYFENAGYDVLEAENGEVALNILDEQKVHLMVLDVMMPKINGLQVLESVRSISELPIIMLTAKVEENDVVTAIKDGADDYIKKPFSMRELLVRVEALMRRSYKDDNGLVVIDGGRIEVDFSRYTMISDGKMIDVTVKEFELLKVFVAHQGVVLSREQLIDQAFGMQYDGYDRTIDTHIKNLRSKIEVNPKKPEIIKTVYGLGYQYIGGDTK